ncbi:MAG TPA: hypothetical protein VMT52_18355, partial [Planctomycetota bacterium]|nr:hypothetical protein [Planctomycetota bacterium]
MCRLRAGVGALALVWLGASSLQAANNPSGWIQTNGWNYLLPLTQTTSCGGGGAAHMASTNWIAPHSIGAEDPKAGDIWDGSGAGLELIDFGGTAGATGIVQGDLGLDPGSAVWASNQFLADSFVGVAIPNGDVVDFQVIAEQYAAQVCPIISCPTAIPNDNVLGIATTYVENETDAPLVVQVCTASDDSIQVWVNNCIVTNVSACRGTAGDCAEVSTIALPPGVSKISVLVWEGGGGWGFRLALRNAAGVRYSDANSAGVLNFIGAGTTETGQTNECVSVSRDYVRQPFSCPLEADDSTTVTIKGSSAGDAGTMFHLEETINVFCPNELEISAVSDGGTVTETVVPDRTEPIIMDLPESVHIGTDTGGMAMSTGSGLGPYTSVDSSGADLWEGGDAFQFQYAEVTGDFDIAVEILDTDHSSGIGRWGRYGLMARQIDEGDGAPAIETQTFSRYTMVNAKLPVWVEQVTVQARHAHNTSGANTHFNNDFSPDVLSARPRFMRLTRRGNIVQGWASNCSGLADGSADPYNDANWHAGSTHDYGAEAPAKLFVGFANGEHNSDGPNTQTVEYRLLPAAPGGSKVRSKTITWDVTREVLNEGLSYMMQYAGKETSRHSLSLVGMNVLGIPSGISGVTFNNTQVAVGEFDFAHDIGGV